MKFSRKFCPLDEWEEIQEWDGESQWMKQDGNLTKFRNSWSAKIIPLTLRSGRRGIGETSECKSKLLFDITLLLAEGKDLIRKLSFSVISCSWLNNIASWILHHHCQYFPSCVCMVHFRKLELKWIYLTIYKF